MNLFELLDQNAIDDIQIESKLESEINPSTLSLFTLKLIVFICLKSKSNLRIAEFGSGLSTKCFSKVLNSKQTLFSFDHEQFYYEKTKNSYDQNIQNIYLNLAHLKSFRFYFKEYTTYNPRVVKRVLEEKPLDLVVIDGPPGFRYGRESVPYLIRKNITDETIFVLDDFNREPELAAFEEWKFVWKNGIESKIFEDGKHGTSVFRFRNPKDIDHTYLLKRFLAGFVK